MTEERYRLIGSQYVPRIQYDIPAPDFSVLLRQRIEPFFTDDEVKVVLDTELASKAAAGSKVIRLRADALFSQLDLDQLVEHEAFIHSATLLNGKHQPWLRCLGAGAPLRRKARRTHRRHRQPERLSGRDA